MIDRQEFEQLTESGMQAKLDELLTTNNLADAQYAFSLARGRGVELKHSCAALRRRIFLINSFVATVVLGIFVGMPAYLLYPRPALTPEQVTGRSETYTKGYKDGYLGAKTILSNRLGCNLGMEHVIVFEAEKRPRDKLIETLTVQKWMEFTGVPYESAAGLVDGVHVGIEQWGYPEEYNRRAITIAELLCMFVYQQDPAVLRRKMSINRQYKEYLEDALDIYRTGREPGLEKE
jgi:hypothetical protein